MYSFIILLLIIITATMTMAILLLLFLLLLLIIITSARQTMELANTAAFVLRTFALEIPGSRFRAKRLVNLHLRPQGTTY